MMYSNEGIRRQDRLLDENSAVNLLKNGEYGVLSMCDGGNEAYGVPINFVWDGGKNIYLHCAPAGRKLRCIDEYPNVSFCVVGKTNVIPQDFTTEYSSIILECFAERHLHPDIRMNALGMLLDKYSPHHKETGMTYAKKSFDRTEIVRLEIKKYSGKSKSIKKKE